MTVKSKTVNTIFQSTLSVRRATHTTASQSRTRNISIHALRKESDQQAKQSAGSLKYFNPRSP